LPGLFGAGAAGSVLAALPLVGRYDMLALGTQGDDGSSGLSAALLLMPLPSLVGAISGAVWPAGKAPALAVAAATLALIAGCSALEFSGLF